MNTNTPLSTFNLTGREFIAEPYPTYRRLHAEMPVCWDARFKWWLISRYEDVHAILRDDRWSSNHLDVYIGALPPDEQATAAPLRELMTRRLIHTDEPEHRRIRMLMQRAFSPRQVEQMRPVIQAAIDGALERFLPGGRMDVVVDLADAVSSHVIAVMLGLPPADREVFKSWTNDIYGFLGVGAKPIRDNAKVATASAQKIRGYLAELFESIRRQPAEGLLSAMVAAEEDGERLSETELFSNVVGLINGSHDTSTNLIANTLYALLRFPKQYRALVVNPELAADVVEEGLRFESPIQMLMRRATEDITIAGATIARGEHAVVMLGAANRDPDVFPDPDRFDITREDNTRHLAFGGGPHFCLGAALGRLEGRLVLETLARRLPNLRLGPQKIFWRPLPVFRGLTALPVEF